MTKTGIAGVVVVVLLACGRAGVGQGLSGESSRLQRTESVVAQLSNAILDNDSAALRRLAMPERLPKLKSDPEFDADLRQALAHQRDGWIRTFGTEDELRNAPPHVATLAEGFDGAFTARLSGADGREWPLYMYEDETGDVFFAGRIPARLGPEIAVQAAVVDINWVFHNFDSVTHTAWTTYETVNGYGACTWHESHVQGSNSWSNQATECTEAGFFSCTVKIWDIPGGMGSGCFETCWDQWSGDDIWWESGDPSYSGGRCHY